MAWTKEFAVAMEKKSDKLVGSFLKGGAVKRPPSCASYEEADLIGDQ
jgi:hypothetical protein